MNDIGHPPTLLPITPFAIPNIRRFLAFRLLFGVRFYYPVFAVLFLDFGLSVGQFAVLNAVWAATIVLCEVPSGALAKKAFHDLMNPKLGIKEDLTNLQPKKGDKAGTIPIKP